MKISAYSYTNHLLAVNSFQTKLMAFEVKELLSKNSPICTFVEKIVFMIKLMLIHASHAIKWSKILNPIFSIS